MGYRPGAADPLLLGHHVGGVAMPLWLLRMRSQIGPGGPMCWNAKGMLAFISADRHGVMRLLPVLLHGCLVFPVMWAH